MPGTPLGTWRDYNHTQFPNVPKFYEECNLQLCPNNWAYVHYDPSLAGNALFLAIFAVLIPPQLYFAIRHRTTGFGVALVSGLILEIVGYAGRVMMHQNPFERGAFLMYLICLTIAPVFISAGIYLCLGRIVKAYDPEEAFTLLRARSYMLVFVACDVFSLVLQAVGGGMAAEAAIGSKALTTGTHIMVAGLAFQVASLSLFAYFCLDFFLRIRKHQAQLSTKFIDLRQSRLFRYFLIALGLATLCIFVRSVFRVAELSGGFGGHLANEQVSFMILDGTMVILACTSLTVFHPGTAFQGHWKDADWSFKPGPRGVLRSGVHHEDEIARHDVIDPEKGVQRSGNSSS